MLTSDHPFFVATQYHPEYKTRPLTPTPVFLGFILASCGLLDAHLKGGEGQSAGLVRYNSLYFEPLTGEAEEDVSISMRM